MLCNFRLLLAILALLQLSAVNGEGLARERRRLTKPRLDKPLTMEELRFECCTAHPMWGCCSGVSNYTIIDSNVSRYQAGCVKAAIQRRIEGNRVITIVVQPEANSRPDTDTYNVEQEQKVTTSSSDCSLNKTQKSATRTLYCKHFEYLFMYFKENIYRSDVLHPGLDSLAECVNFYSSTEYFNPAEIVHTLSTWYSTTVRRHHKCCNFPDYLFTLHSPFRTVTCRQDRRPAATIKWGEHMVDAAKSMRMADMLESLGKIGRRKCLRGCVGDEEVECCNILFLDLDSI